MKTKQIARIVLGVALTMSFAGCMSMEEMLASDNVIWRDIGETKAVDFVLDGANPLEKRLEVVPKIADQKKLAKIVVSRSVSPEVKSEARKRIDETAALATIALDAPDRGDQVAALKQISKSEDSRIEATWIFVERKPSSNVPQVLLKGLSDAGKAKFAASFTEKINTAVAASEEAERLRRKYGDSLASGKMKEFKVILGTLVKLAPCVEDENVIVAILKRRDIADVKGTQFDFLTPLEGQYQKAVAERKERERNEFLAALTDDERITLLEKGRLVKQGKTIVATDGPVAAKNKVTSTSDDSDDAMLRRRPTASDSSTDDDTYKISRDDVLNGIKDQALAAKMQKAEANRKAEMEFARKVKEYTDGLEYANIVKKIEKTQAIEDEKLRDVVLANVIESCAGKTITAEECANARQILANSPIREKFELGIEQLIKDKNANLELCGLFGDRTKSGRILADAIKNTDFKISAWNKYGKYIDDPASLAELALLFKDEDECSEVLGKIKDDQTLAKLAVENEHPALRSGALACIKDAAVKEKALDEIKAEEARQLELLRKAVVVAKLDAEEFIKIVQSNSEAFDELPAKESAANVFKGRALLIEDIHIWNADASTHGDSMKRVLLGRKASECISFHFAEPFKAATKSFKHNTGSTTVFGIVTGDTDGGYKNFHLVGGVVKDEKDIESIAKIAKYYGLSKEKVREMSDPAVEWPVMKLAKELGVDYVPADERLEDPAYKAKAAAVAEAEKANMEAMRESVVKMIPVAKRDANDLMQMFPDYSKSLSFDAADAARDIFQGRALLLTGMEVFNEPGNDGNPAISRFGMQTSPGASFYVTFKKPFKDATKDFKSGYPRTKGVTVFAIVTGQDYGKHMLLDGGVIKDENDVEGILKIVNGYRMSEEKIKEMSDQAKRPAKKLAKKLGMTFNLAD